MKTIINKYLITSAMLLSFSACSDFWEMEPLSQGTEAIVFKTPEHFEQAANALYNVEGWKDYNNTAYTNMDKNTDISGLSTNGGGSTPEGHFKWDKPYSFIRTCNILLQKADEYPGNIDEIAWPIGIAHFFRAWQHFYLLRTFGGVPIVDHVLDVNDQVVYGARNSRYEVFNFIISDLRTAIPLLPIESEISDSDKGKVSKEAAKAFLARVLLYEATWEKYVPTIGYDLDGDGKANGAGINKPEGYPSISDMLTEAKQMSREVIDEAEKGTFQLWNECDSLSYYYLFNIDDKGGNLPNFKGKGKSTNKEFIFYKKYDYDLSRGGINLSHTVMTWQATNISASFGESFLCRNGLPIRISRTGNMADAENNPQFLGYEDSFEAEYRNRDYRFIGCAFLPDRTTFSSRPEDGRPLTQLGQPYPEADFPKNNDVYDPSDPAYGSKTAVFRPTLRNNSTHSGYGSRKYLIEGANRAVNTESADYPLIRLAEVYLIYAEATCELNNGAISDEDLNISINKTRARAGVAPLTNDLIKNVWDAGYWDHKEGKTVCKKMTMLDEIRRERACELFGEGFRMDDLKRWGIAHINLVGQKLGRHVLGTAYEKFTANDATYFGEPCYYPEKYPLLYGVYEGYGTNDPDYGRSIATLAGNLNFTQRDYLEPIPLQQIRLNPKLVQNPGW